MNGIIVDIKDIKNFEEFIISSKRDFFFFLKFCGSKKNFYLHEVRDSY